MKFFRMRLILALAVGITLVSVASTYFEVLAHKHALRLELVRKNFMSPLPVLFYTNFSSFPVQFGTAAFCDGSPSAFRWLPQFNGHTPTC